MRKSEEGKGSGNLKKTMGYTVHDPLPNMGGAWGFPKENPLPLLLVLARLEPNKPPEPKPVGGVVVEERPPPNGPEVGAVGFMPNGELEGWRVASGEKDGDGAGVLAVENRLGVGAALPLSLVIAVEGCPLAVAVGPGERGPVTC